VIVLLCRSAACDPVNTQASEAACRPHDESGRLERSVAGDGRAEVSVLDRGSMEHGEDLKDMDGGRDARLR